MKHPEVLNTVPHFTPIKKVDEVKANIDLKIQEDFQYLPDLPSEKISSLKLSKMPINEVVEEILKAHKEMVL